MGLFKKKSTAVQRQTQASESAPSASAQRGYVQNAPAPSEDPSLPGTAGYWIRKSGDKMPHRFNFVRPDGRPEPKTKKSWWRAS